jgi:hypothetical protein
MHKQAGANVALLSGHKGRVGCLHADDRTMHSGGDDSVLRVWDMRVSAYVRKYIHTPCSFMEAFIQG